MEDSFYSVKTMLHSYTTECIELSKKLNIAELMMSAELLLIGLGKDKHNKSRKIEDS